MGLVKLKELGMEKRIALTVYDIELIAKRKADTITIKIGRELLMMT